VADQTGTPDTAPAPGAAYADARERYRLDEPIAAGGMGEVWRGTDTVLHREVAVKLLRQAHADDPVFRTRFETEARHAAALHHPGVAQVYDFGAGDPETRRPPYLVMEYVAGQPLSALLRPGEPMAAEAAAALLAGAGDALGAAHARGIVHRDVKPANLLVTDDRRIKITDFGIARAADAAALTRTGEVLGTPQYLSPEQAEGAPATPASDVYSLGAVGFECLAGRRPYVADSPVATALAHLREPVPELPATVPPALAAVIHRSLTKDPAERYADGAAFAAAVREAVAHPAGAAVAEPVTEQPATPDPTRVLTAPAVPAVPAARPEPAWRARARAVPVPVWAAAGVFVVVLAIAALAATSGGGSQTPTGQRSRHTASTQASSPTSTSTSASTPTSAPTGPPTTPQPKPGNGKPGKGKAKGHEHGKGHQ
jgi:serine/threonine-protein kinase